MAGDAPEPTLRTADRDTHKEDPTTIPSAFQEDRAPAVPSASPKEVAEAASIVLSTLADKIANWPAGIISLIGSVLAIGTVAAEIWELDPFNTTEFVTTVIVGAVLALAGPLVVGVDHAGARRLVKNLAATATSSQAEQGRQEAQERASRTLLDDLERNR
jgi:hypothetical protein